MKFYLSRSKVNFPNSKRKFFTNTRITRKRKNKKNKIILTSINWDAFSWVKQIFRLCHINDNNSPIEQVVSFFSIYCVSVCVMCGRKDNDDDVSICDCHRAFWDRYKIKDYAKMTCSTEIGFHFCRPWERNSDDFDWFAVAIVVPMNFLYLCRDISELDTREPIEIVATVCRRTQHKLTHWLWFATHIFKWTMLTRMY